MSIKRLDHWVKFKSQSPLGREIQDGGSLGFRLPEAAYSFNLNNTFFLKGEKKMQAEWGATPALPSTSNVRMKPIDDEVEVLTVSPG